jgi:hypothetical protein
MKKWIFINLLIIGINFFAKSQVITFQRSYGNGLGHIKPTLDGGYILAGFDYSPLDTLGDILLVKLDNNFDTVWTSLSGAQGWNSVSGVEQSADSSYYVGGTQCCIGNGGYDFNLSKFDKNGTILWSKNYGGPNYEFVHALTLAKDGNPVIGGETGSYGGSYLIKTDTSGAIIFSHSYKFAQSSNQSIEVIKPTPDSGLIIAGHPGIPNNCMYLMKLNSAGQREWAKILFDSSGLGIGDIYVTDDNKFMIAGGIVVAGSTPTADCLIAKLDSTGNIIWAKKYGGHEGETLLTICKSNQGGYIAAGISNSIFQAGGYPDGYMIKINDSGDTLWTRDYGSNNLEYFFSVVATNDGGALASSPLYNGSYLDYVIKVDSMGNSGCNEFSFPTHVLQATFDTIPVSIIDSAGGTMIDLPIHATSNCIILAYCYAVEVAEIKKENSACEIFPNPTTNFITIHYDITSNTKTTVTLFNLYGQIVYSENLQGFKNPEGLNETKIDMRSFAAGIYFVKMNVGGKEEVRKVVKY